MSETFQKSQKYPYSRTSCSLDADQHLCFSFVSLTSWSKKDVSCYLSLLFSSHWGSVWKVVVNLLFHVGLFLT